VGGLSTSNVLSQMVECPVEEVTVHGMSMWRNGLHTLNTPCPILLCPS